MARILPRLRRDWAHPSHVCAGTGLTPPTSAPGLAGRSRAAVWPQGKRNWTVLCQADDPAADSTPAIGQMTLVEVVRPIIGTVTLSRHLGACNALLGVAGPRRRVNPTRSYAKQLQTNYKRRSDPIGGHSCAAGFAPPC